MDIASEAVTRCRDEIGPQAQTCSCALHEPRHDSDQPGIVGEVARFTSFSEAWLAHARDYGQQAVRRFNLGAGSLVLEIAGSVPARPAGVSREPVVIDPERALGLAAQGNTADLIVANNVLAQVPDLNGFVASLAAVLKPAGILTLEFPHLLRLIQAGPSGSTGDGHFSLSGVESLLARHGLRVFDLDELRTGSLRLFCCHVGSAFQEVASVARLRAAEKAAGLCSLAAYCGFRQKAAEIAAAPLEPALAV